VSVINTDPVLLRIEERRAVIKATLQNITRDGEVKRARYDEEEAANDLAIREAHEAGREAPPKYERPADTTAATINALVAEDRALAKERDARVGELRPEIEPEVAETVAAVREALASVVAALDEAAATLRPAMVLLAKTRTAEAMANKNSVIHPHAGERTPTFLTDVDLLALGRGEWDPLALEPIRPPDRPVVERVDQADEQPSRLGLKQRGAFGTPPAPPKGGSPRDDFL
jgi:hypothetical protein